MVREYGEGGFVPTISGHTKTRDSLVLETIDPRQSTDLVSVAGEPLTRVGDNVTDEQQEILALHERN